MLRSRAAGRYAVAAGQDGEAAGLGSVAWGGVGNAANEDFSVALGGLGNGVDAEFGLIAGGKSNQVTAPWGVVLGGHANRVTAAYALAAGRHALAGLHGGLTLAGFRFQARGDAQSTRVALGNVSVDERAVELGTDGPAGSERLVIPDDTLWVFHALVGGTSRHADQGSAWIAEGVVRRSRGVSALLGRPLIRSLVKSGDGLPAEAGVDTGWRVDVDVDPVAGALVFRCTGEAGQAVRWFALVDLAQVAFPGLVAAET